MRRAVFAGLMLASVSAWAAISSNVLNSSDHAAIEGTLGNSVFGITLIVDDTCALPIIGSPCNVNYAGPEMIPAANDASIAQTIVYPGTPATSTGTPNPHVPYGVMNFSYSGYGIGSDQQNYSLLEAGDAVFIWPFCTSGGAQAYPPVVMSNALLNTSASSGLCSYAYGIEFSITSGYLGLSTDDASDVSASLATVFAAMANAHPSWTWGDVKGALRQTASNWAAGYATIASPGGVPSLGYGNINYAAAVALSGPSALYLQPPGMAVQNHGYYASITVYPFPQTRRARERIYIGGTWPAASSSNELTAAQVSAAGGTIIYDSGGATGAQSFSYAPVASGSATFTAITLDASGNGSRIESFAQSTQSFVVGTACFQ